MTDRIQSVTSDPEALRVSFGPRERAFSWLWLRDHSQDPESFHPQTKQRLLETFGIGDPGPAEAEIRDDGATLLLRWGDRPAQVRYTAGYLAAVGAPADLYDVTSDGQVPWDGAAAADKPERIEHDAVTAQDGALRDMLAAVRRDGLVLVTGMPLRPESVRDVMGRIGYLRTTLFGTLWEFSADGKIADTASTPLDIKPHTDGTYSHDAPGLQALLCLDYDATGGDNTFVDGLHLAGVMRRDHPDEYRTLCETPIPGQYIGDGAHLVAQRPVFRTDPSGKVAQVSYNNHDRAPFLLPEPQMAAVYRGLALFDRLANDPANQVGFGLRPGEMVVFDNWRLLHGRKAFQGRRRMAGCYLNREDFESRLRMLSPPPTDMAAGQG